MKKIVSCIFAALLAALTLSAQTPEEILAKMDQETSRFDTEGFSMVMEIKIPILGSFATKAFTLGGKYKAITSVKGEESVMWSDGKTTWDYNSAKNEITIANAKPSESNDTEDNMKMLDSVTKGYDVRLRKETAEAWYFRCTKQKTNTDKDDPKTMDLVVSKATYLPMSLSATLKGVTVTLSDFAVGVTEQEVTFDPSKYPSATITDTRE